MNFTLVDPKCTVFRTCLRRASTPHSIVELATPQTLLICQDFFKYLQGGAGDSGIQAMGEWCLGIYTCTENTYPDTLDAEAECI